MDESRLLKCFQTFVDDSTFFSRLNGDESYTDYRSCWGELCIKYSGSYDHPTALQIKTRYCEDLNQIRKKIYQIFNPQVQYSFSIKVRELNELSSKSKRKKLLAEFSRILTLKLQKNTDTNCDLVSNCNWLSTDYKSWNGE
jgi:hypothetical protein